MTGISLYGRVSTRPEADDMMWLMGLAHIT